MAGVASELNGDFIVGLIPNKSTAVLQEFIFTHASYGSIIKTDGWVAYTAIDWAAERMRNLVTVHDAGPTAS